MASTFSPVKALASIKLAWYSLAKALASSPLTSLLGKSYLFPTSIIFRFLSAQVSSSWNHFLARRKDSLLDTSKTMTAPSAPL